MHAMHQAAKKLLNDTMNHTGMNHDMGGMAHNMGGMAHDMSGMAHDMSGMNHDMGGMVHDMGMMMSFHGGYKETILFDFWETKTILAFVLSCLGLFVCAALYEGLKLGREKLMVYEVKRREKTLGDSESKPTIRNCHCNKPDDKTSDESEIINVSRNQHNCCANETNRDYLLNNQDTADIRFKTSRARLFSRSHLCQTLLHMLQITVSYLLMLVFMTYNSYLCLSVVLGAGLGYFIFGFQRVTSIDVNEHCH